MKRKPVEFVVTEVFRVEDAAARMAAINRIVECYLTIQMRRELEG
ncbi:MAG: hypothetical protein VB096_10440 [Pseudoflavonifractor sp.]|nr:hypothetical protein [Pseudoflavonifractor sp.]